MNACNRKYLSLQEIRVVQLKLIQYLQEVCEENNLHYSLCYGSLIGAIRHKGFIPWDDDMDIVMPRPDYEKIIRIINAQNSIYQIFDSRIKSDYYQPYAKLVDTSTLIDEGQSRKIKDYGIYIDIFPEDGLPNDEEKREQYWKKINRIRLLSSYVNTKKLKGESFFKALVRRLFYYIFAVLPKNLMAKKLNKFALKYDFNKSDIVSVTITGHEGRKNEMPRKVLENYMYADFEDKKLMIVKDYDFMLTKLFGNYMQLPPENQRYSHGFKAWIKEKPFKIFGIMLVKNEVDIVGHVLKAAEKWADKIFILDNGSTDGTWELIQSMADDVITPWKQYFGEYHDGLRADVFNEFRSYSKPGDWWCFKLDADEFYIEDPRVFLSKISKRYHWVGKRDIGYLIALEDYKEFSFSENFDDNVKLLNYINPICESEGRFFRDRKNLTWKNEWGSHYPPHIGVQAYDYIIVKHYRERSPQQLKARNHLRVNTRAAKEGIVFQSQTEIHNFEDVLSKRIELMRDPKNICEYKKMPLNLGNFKQNLIKNFIKRLLIALNLYN